MDVQVCERCNTPRNERSACVTCQAEAEGLALVTRSGFAPIREMMELLEDKGFSADMERIPPRRPEEKHHPLWNLYVPREEQEEFMEEATSGDYDHLLQTVMKWVDVI